ncbi:MucBP domain-containing protein [Fructilactobacillus sp. Tb1]|uniref:MucBP domain-containing protein n=1 Tax=Fructilactobacillus sp. Tb1 TaxID=3422304 RepID=UPI003D2E01AE
MKKTSKKSVVFATTFLAVSAALSVSALADTNTQQPTQPQTEQTAVQSAQQAPVVLAQAKADDATSAAAANTPNQVSTTNTPVVNAPESAQRAGIINADWMSSANVQFGTLNQDMKGPSGHIYDAGTQVARSIAGDGTPTGDYTLSLFLNQGSAGVGAQVDPAYVTAGATQHYDNIGRMGQTVIQNAANMTDATGSLTPVNPTQPSQPANNDNGGNQNPAQPETPANNGGDNTPAQPSQPATQSKVNFYFHDQDGNSIDTNDGHASFTWNGTPGTDWNYTNWVPEINGYQYSHVDVYNGQNVTHDLQGTYSANGDTNVYLTYNANKTAKVNFYFHDQDGNSIDTNDGHASFTWNGTPGTDWNYTNWVPEINGYQYSHVDVYNGQNVTHDLQGTYSANGDTNVYLTYNVKKPAKVTFYFHDQDGNSIDTNDGHASFTWNGTSGDDWNYTNWVPEINGYQYNHVDVYNGQNVTHDLQGTYSANGDTNVYLTYEKVGTVNVYYHDQNGNEIKPSTSISGQVATPWSLDGNVPEIAGYTYNHADQYNPTYFDHDLTGNYPLDGPTNLYLTYFVN